MKKLTTALLLFLFSVSLHAQNGSLNGTVTDAVTGETIPGAKVTLEGQGKGAMSDLDGNFSIPNLAPGKYNIICSYYGYNSIAIADVLVNKNETSVVPIALEKTVKEIGQVTVKVTINRESNANLLQLQRNSATAVDGISAETIKRSPDRSVGDALKRVSGASIQDNKFAVIRGLNDRYNAAYLNGAPLPSSESDRKAFAFDIFPVNMLDNLTIVKTASADLPAEFSGGIIQIKTKDIPEKNFQSVSIGGGYNTITTFKDQVDYKGGKMDWLGLDDGTRALPAAIPSREDFPELINDQADLAKDFSTDWSLQEKQYLPNLSMQYAGGLHKLFKANDFGFVGSLSYNKTNNYNETERKSYTDNFAGGTGASQIEDDFLDKTYSSQILAGAMGNFSLKIGQRNSLSFRNLYSINSDDRVIVRTGEIEPLESNPTLLRSTARWYTGNQIYSGQLSGDHQFKTNRYRIDWVTGYSAINRTIPNLRRSIYTRYKYFNDPSDPNMLDTMYVANIATANVGPDYGGGMFFSSNKENILSGKLNFMVRLDTIARISTDIKIGAMVQNRSRNFTARQLGYTTYGIVGGAVSFDQSLLYLPEDSIFAPENMGLISPGKGGFKLTDGTKPSDAYQASSDLYSAYLMLDNKFGEKVRLNWGARLEQFTQLLTAMRADETDLSIDTKKMDVLPSFNLIVSPTKKQNIRLSGSQTLNRPEYRELAPFAFYDFNTQFVLSGNDSLLRCRITNADLRYEWYPGNNQILSAGVFYKYFENPIEQIARPDVANEISYKNAPTATNYGFELEFRTVIGSLFKVDSSSFLNNLTLFSNLSIIRSIVDVSDNVGTLYETRPLQGQSPYVFNGGIFFQDKRNKMNYSLNINRVGPRIYILGSIIQPDIWEKSRTFLDFQITKAFFKEKFEVKLNIQNILAQDLVFYQNNYATEKKAKSLKRFANSLFLADPNNRNGFDKDVDDLVWRTKFGSTFSLVLTYKF